MNITIDHPSNRLYRGEATNFEQAMEWHIQALQSEINTARSFLPADHDGSEQGYIDTMEGFVTIARTALAEYQDHMQSAEERLLEMWRKSGSPNKEYLAGILENDDYSRLAV